MQQDFELHHCHTIPVFDQLPLLFGQLRENGKNGFSCPNKNNSKTLQPYVAFLRLEKYELEELLSGKTGPNRVLDGIPLGS